MADSNYNINEGGVFGKWVVLDPKVVKKNGKAHILCKCSCEKETERLVYRYALFKGLSTHCGCVKRVIPYHCKTCGTTTPEDFGNNKSACKVCDKLRKRKYNARYYKDNKEYLDAYNSAYNKERRKKNIEYLKEQSRKYYLANRDSILEKSKQYYYRNRERILERGRLHYHSVYKHNKEAMERRRLYNTWYNKTYKEKRSAYSKIRWIKNKKQEIEKHRVYHNNRRRVDNSYRIRCNLSSRISGLLKGKKSSSIMRYLGCSLDELKRHLENMFDEDMTWENYGRHGWHVDHIKPLAAFDLSNESELAQACHYTNLQPLWAEENLRKNSYYRGKRYVRTGLQI